MQSKRGVADFKKWMIEISSDNKEGKNCPHLDHGVHIKAEVIAGYPYVVDVLLNSTTFCQCDGLLLLLLLLSLGRFFWILYRI